MKRTTLTLSLVIVLLAGCQLIGSERDHTAFRLTNDSDSVVDVVFVSADAPDVESIIYRGLGPHDSVAIADKFRGDVCMSGVLIARTAKGDEVARRDEPVCLPGEWVINRGP